MKNFLLSGSGRILALAVGIALAGAGTAKLLDGVPGIAVGSFAVLIAFALAVVAFATSVREHFGAAVITVVILPQLALLGEVGRGFMPRSAAFAVVIAGLAAIAFAARRQSSHEAHPGRLVPAQST